MTEEMKEQQPINAEGGEPTPVASEPLVPKSEVDKLYARTKQAEEREKQYKEQLEKLRPAESAPSQNFEKILEEKFELRHLGYTPEEISFIKKNTPEGKSMLDSVNDPYVKAAINGRRSESTANQATPVPSARSLYVGDKSFKEMSPAERAENFSGENWRRRKKFGR